MRGRNICLHASMDEFVVGRSYWIGVLLLMQGRRGMRIGKRGNLATHLRWTISSFFSSQFTSIFSLPLAVCFHCPIAWIWGSAGVVDCLACLFYCLLLEKRFARRLQRATRSNTKSMIMVVFWMKYQVICVYSDLQIHGALAGDMRGVSDKRYIDTDSIGE